MARILVVEDEAPNIEILSRLLSKKGYEIVVAQSRDSAISTMQTAAADLVLMDIGIPNVDGEVVNDAGGLEATRWIKSNPQTRSVPIIAISAYAMLDERKRFLDAGCDDVQPKPFDFVAVLQSVQRCLKAPK